MHLYRLACLKEFEVSELVESGLSRRQELEGMTPALIEYVIKLARFFTVARQPEMFLGEQEDRLEDTINLIRRMGYGGELIYYVTRPSEPYPANSGWDNLYQKLIYKEHILKRAYFIFVPNTNTISRAPGNPYDINVAN